MAVCALIVYAGPQRMTRTKREVYTRQPLLCSKIGALNLAGYEPKVTGVRPVGKDGQPCALASNVHGGSSGTKAAWRWG